MTTSAPSSARSMRWRRTKHAILTSSCSTPPEFCPKSAVTEALRLSAILGLTPMAIAGGANIPLARAVVGGVMAAMVMVLFVVPILYLLLKKDEAGLDERA